MHLYREFPLFFTASRKRGVYASRSKVLCRCDPDPTSVGRRRLLERNGERRIIRFVSARGARGLTQASQHGARARPTQRTAAHTSRTRSASTDPPRESPTAPTRLHDPPRHATATPHAHHAASPDLKPHADATCDPSDNDPSSVARPSTTEASMLPSCRTLGHETDESASHGFSLDCPSQSAVP